MKFLKNEWITLLASTVFLGKVLLFFHQNPDFFLLWDWPGHIHKARVATWPWSGGWDTSFWGGYPTTLYPNLFHLGVKAAIGSFSNVRLGVEVLILAIFCLQLHALFLYTKRVFAQSHLAVLRNFSFLAVVVYLTGRQNGALMGSFLGTLWTGGGPGALGTALWLYLMATDNWLAAGLFMGLIFLTHPLTALAGLIYIGSAIFYELLNRNFGKLREWILSLIIATAIGLPWILPSLDPSLNSIANNLPTAATTATWAGVIFLIFVAFQGKKHWSPWLYAGILIGFVSILPNAFWNALVNIGIRGVHPFRLWWYQWIATIPLVFSWIEKEGGLRSWFLRLNRFAVAFPVITLFAVLALNSQVKQTTFLKFDFTALGDRSGRVMDASNYAFALDYPQALEHSLVAKTQLLGSTRWLYESGSLGYLYYSLKVAIDPRSFNDGTSLLNFLDEHWKPKVPIDIKETADLLGVNYTTFTALKKPSEEESDITQIGTFYIGNTKKDVVQLPYFMKKISDEPLVVTLPNVPAYNQNEDLMNWWTTTDHKTLVSDEEYPGAKDVNLNQPAVHNIEVNPTRISFTVEGTKPAPIFVKFSYSPYWEAEALDQFSSTSKPYWITPGNMVVYGYGHIQLDWKTPWYTRIFSPVSVGLAVACSLLLLVNQRKHVS